MAGNRNALPFLRQDNATWLVCLAMHLDETFADRVYGELALPTKRALAPSPGLDLRLIARHATWLQDRRQRLHRGLVVCELVFVIALLTATVGLSGTGGGSGTAPGAVGVAVLAVLVAFLWSVSCRVRQAWHAVSMVERDTPWDPGRGSMTKAQEQRLGQVNDANLCIYSPTLRDPFPGLGVMLTSDVLPPIDVTRPKDRKKPVTPFTASELHGHLGRVLHNRSPQDGTGRNITYIDGTWILHYPEIYPDGNRLPAINLPKPRVKEIADNPSEGARTYVSGQWVRYGGLLVCNLSVRFTLARGRMSWDVSARLLPPVTLAFLKGSVGPTTRVARPWWAAARAIQSFPLDVATAPVHVVGHLLRRSRAAQLLQPVGNVSKRTETKLFSGVGAIESLREHVAGNGTLDFNQRNDVLDGFQRLLDVVYGEISLFLEARNVSVNEFRKNQGTTVTTILGNINAANVAIGGGNAGNQHQQNMPGAGGNPQPPGSP